MPVWKCWPVSSRSTFRRRSQTRKKHFESAHTWRVIASSGPLPCWSNRMFDISWHWAYAAYLALILWYFLELSAIYSTLRPRQTLYRLPRNAFMHTMPIERRRSAGLSDSSWEWNLKERERSGAFPINTQLIMHRTTRWSKSVAAGRKTNILIKKGFPWK